MVQRGILLVLAGCLSMVATAAWPRAATGGLLISAVTTSTSTTVAPTTTTTTRTTTTAAALPSKPVRIPKNNYAGEQIMKLGMIEIPKLGLVHETFQGVTLHNIDRGPAHWPGTALPGHRGNTVFAGHRVTNSRPFRHLDTLVAGDEVIFTVGSTRSVYQVTGHEIVKPSATWIADQTDGYTGTIYACHPPGSAAYRYVVRLKLVSPPADV